jgi:hypothetical protein
MWMTKTFNLGDPRGMTLLTRRLSAPCAAARASTSKDVAWTDITYNRSRSSRISSSTNRISSTTPNELFAGISHGGSGGGWAELLSELGYVQFEML